jgi:putative transposase
MEKQLKKYQNTYRIDTARLKHWDYGSHGFYFITICSKNRQPYFGKITVEHVETQYLASLLQQTEIGKIAHQYWAEIPNHFPFIELDEFIVMPDHLHGILFFNRPNHHPWKSNAFGPQSENLASVIRGYKATVKRYATINNIEFAWQPRYHDHIIRSDRDLNNIRNYIRNNPVKFVETHKSLRCFNN